MRIAHRKQRLASIAKRFRLKLLNYTSQPSLYKRTAVFRIETNKGIFSLKPFAGSMLSDLTTLRQMRNTAKLVRILKEHKYPHLPKWPRTKSGRYWVQSKGRPYYLMEWIEGTRLSGLDDYVKLGHALALLHTTAGHKLTAKQADTLMEINEMKKQDRQFRRRHLRRISMFKHRHRKWLREHMEQCFQLSDGAWAMMNEPEIRALLAAEPDHPCIVHGDITSPNVVLSRDQLYIIDWDRVKVGSIYIELAKAIMNTSNLNPVCMEAILRGYEEKKPLLPAERRLVYALSRLPREVWHCTHLPRQSNTRTLLDILEKTWPYRLEAVQWLETWANQEKRNG